MAHSLLILSKFVSLYLQAFMVSAGGLLRPLELGRDLRAEHPLEDRAIMGCNLGSGLRQPHGDHGVLEQAHLVDCSASSTLI